MSTSHSARHCQRYCSSSGRAVRADATPSMASLPSPPIHGRSFGRFDETADLIEKSIRPHPRFRATSSKARAQASSSEQSSSSYRISTFHRHCKLDNLALGPGYSLLPRAPRAGSVVRLALDEGERPSRNSARTSSFQTGAIYRKRAAGTGGDRTTSTKARLRTCELNIVV
jgi:hypothetical protein